MPVYAWQQIARLGVATVGIEGAHLAITGKQVLHKRFEAADGTVDVAIGRALVRHHIGHQGVDAIGKAVSKRLDLIHTVPGIVGLPERDDLGVPHVTGIQQVARRRVINAWDVAQFLPLPIDTDRSRIMGATPSRKPLASGYAAFR